MYLKLDKASFFYMVIFKNSKNKFRINYNTEHGLRLIIYKENVTYIMLYIFQLILPFIQVF